MTYIHQYNFIQSIFTAVKSLCSAYLLPFASVYFLPDCKLWIFNELSYLNLIANSLAAVNGPGGFTSSEPVQADSFIWIFGIGVGQIAGAKDKI